MPSDVPVFYWDSNMFLSYIDKTPERMPYLDSLLSDSDEGKIRIITSVVSIVEVAFAAQEQQKRVLSATEEQNIEALWQDHRVVQLVEFHEGIARDARGLIRDGLLKKWRLKPKDAIHLASARYYEAVRMHTYDRALRKYGPLIGRPVEEPSTARPRLLDAP
jgi:predicted nucleic acid-binding protein